MGDVTSTAGRPSRKRKVIAAGVTTVAALVGIAAWDVIAPGLLIVRLRNVGEETLRAVEVASVFSAVELGDLQPGRASTAERPPDGSRGCCPRGTSDRGLLVRIPDVVRS
jgi:hypothetical protein